MDDLERAVAALERGGTIVYPTETVYGLGADATSENALQRLAAVKQRSRGKPIAVLVSSREMLEQIVAAVPAAAARLIDEFWPGPLTLAFPAKGGMSAVLTGGSGTVAARISSHPIAQALVERLGKPLTSPSANPAGAPPAREIEAARAYFGAAIDAYLDGGALPGGPASTVVDCSSESPRLVREGRISAAAIEAVAEMRLRRE